MPMLDRGEGEGADDAAKAGIDVADADARARGGSTVSRTTLAKATSHMAPDERTPNIVLSPFLWRLTLRPSTQNRRLTALGRGQQWLGGNLPPLKERLH